MINLRLMDRFVLIEGELLRVHLTHQTLHLPACWKVKHADRY